MNRSAARLDSRALAVGISTALLSALLLVAGAHTAGAAGAKFTAITATMTVPRSGHTATLLLNGQVFLAGGDNLFPGTGTTYNTAELYDPVANTFAALTATMTTARENFAATLLPNGQVLIAGGFNDSPGSDCLNTAEVYDPVANTFTALTATMTSARCGPTATLLLNGRVVIVGGDLDGVTFNTAELYDPVANTFTALTATMTTPRTGHTATLLPNGQVLLTGGGNARHTTQFDTAELYDPVANTFTALTATMTIAREVHTATQLANGQVLLTGGGSIAAGGSSFVILRTAEVYDPMANTFTALTATMTTPRFFHTAAPLLNGEVLLTGGNESTSGPALNTAELYTSGPAPTLTATATPTPTPTPTPPSGSTLTSAITATDTCIPVSDTSIFSPTGGSALIGTELISYTGLGTSCSGASAARPSEGTPATAGVLTGVMRNLNGQGGAHAAGTRVTPTVSACVGDCNGNGSVTVDEILTMVNIALGNTPVTMCEAGDGNHDGEITVDEILTAVNNALNGCAG